MICLKLYLKAKNTSGGRLAPRSVGVTPCRTDMDCIERVNLVTTINVLSKIKTHQAYAHTNVINF